MVGRKIGLYRVLRKIGEGGMGTVYEATHTTLGRRAAIKILRRNALSDATAAARFFNGMREKNHRRKITGCPDLGNG